MASKPLTITIPLDADIVEGIINGDKVCLGLISKAVQAAIERGYHLRKAEDAKVTTVSGHRCVLSEEMWDFLLAYSKVTGQTINEV